MERGVGRCGSPRRRGELPAGPGVRGEKVGEGFCVWVGGVRISEVTGPGRRRRSRGTRVAGRDQATGLSGHPAVCGSPASLRTRPAARGGSVVSTATDRSGPEAGFCLQVG